MPAPRYPTFELSVREVRCIDVNDGGLNGHTDRVFLFDHLSGISDGRSHDLGKFKNGSKRAYPTKVIMEPKYPSSFRLVLFEKDLENFSGNDHIGEFTVGQTGRVRPGKNTKLATPASAPSHRTVLAMNGSGAKYVITLEVRPASA